MSPDLVRAMVAAAMVVLWLSYLQLEEIPWWARLLFLAFTLFSALRPGDGLLLAAAFAPLAPALEVAGASPGRRSETIVIAFLCGFLAGAVVRRERLTADRRLGSAIALLAVVILASAAVVILAFPQFYVMPPAAFVRQFGTLIATSYLGDADGRLAAVYEGARVLEGLLLMAAVMVIGRRDGTIALRTARVLLWGAVANALLLASAFAIHHISAPFTDGDVWDLLSDRFVFPFRDPNAGGSYFVMAAVAMIGWLGLSRGRQRWWAAAAIPVVWATWLTGSRAAVLAGVFVSAAVVATLLIRRRIAWRRVAIAGAAAVLLPALAVALFPGRLLGQLGPTMSVRAGYAAMSWSMWRTAPIFGMGIGQYYPRSSAFLRPELTMGSSMENAHNYFAQLAVELGAIGLACFLFLLVAAALRLGRIKAEGALDRKRLALAGGLAAFLLTSLVGHPLLVPAAGFPFWMLAGAALARQEGGVEPRPPGEGVTRQALSFRWGLNGTVAVVVFAVLMVCSVPPRVHRAIEGEDLSAVSYGFSRRLIDAGTGTEYCRIGPEARSFVHAGASAIAFPYSGLEGQGPCDFDVRIDGQLVMHVRVEDASWSAMRILVPAARPGRPFRMVEWRITRVGPDEVATGAASTSGPPQVRLGTVSVVPPYRHGGP